MLEELRIRILAKFDVGNWPDRSKIDPGTSISTMVAELARLSPQTRSPPITPRDIEARQSFCCGPIPLTDGPIPLTDGQIFQIFQVRF